MKFDAYLEQAWNDHATAPEDVAIRLDQGIDFVETEPQLTSFANLAVHVLGSHLGRWEATNAFLEKLRTHSHFSTNTETDRGLRRFSVAVQIASTPQAPEKVIAADEFSPADKIRILSTSSGLLLSHDLSRAIDLYELALQVASEIGAFEKADPAACALAIAGNNLACEIEDKKDRSEKETRFLLKAAESARHYWGIAGTWLEVAFAEYRLAMSCIELGRSDRAEKHAENSIELMKSNNATAEDLQYGVKALSAARDARRLNSERRN